MPRDEYGRCVRYMVRDRNAVQVAEKRRGAA